MNGNPYAHIYRSGGKQYKLGPWTTSENELVDIFKAWVAISVAFAIVLTDSIFSIKILGSFLFSAVTVGIGFLFHELAHKIVAQKFGCWAEFRSDDKMLALAIIMSFFGFIFAAPGAVMIGGRVTKKENGFISAAGPLTNILLAILFFAIGLQMPYKLFRYGMMINAWLALFNMLPFFIFDGAKIFRWSKLVWGIQVAVAISLLYLVSYLPGL